MEFTITLSEETILELVQEHLKAKGYELIGNAEVVHEVDDEGVSVDITVQIGVKE